MVQVTLNISGAMREYFDREEYLLELPQAATLNDLLVRIGECFGDRLGSVVWHREAQRFRGAVVIVSDGHVLKERGVPLRDGATINVFKAMVGG